MRRVVFLVIAGACLSSVCLSESKSVSGESSFCVCISLINFSRSILCILRKCRVIVGLLGFSETLKNNE